MVVLIGISIEVKDWRQDKMLNDSNWLEYNDGQRAILRASNGETIASIQKDGLLWYCMMLPKLLAQDFYYKNIDSIEEVEWQVTLYIYNRCNEIANQLHKIRDHLPSIHELAEKAGVTKILD